MYAVAVDGSGKFISGTHRNDGLAGEGLFVLNAKLTAEVIYLQGVSVHAGAIRFVSVGNCRFLADITEGVIELSTHGEAVPQSGRGGGKELISTAVTHRSELALLGVNVHLQVGNIVSYVTEGRKAHHEGGIAPHGEGDDHVVNIERGVEGLFAALVEDGHTSADAHIGHEREAVSGRHGSRIENVDETVVTGCNTYASHTLVPGCSALVHLPQSKDGIRGKTTVSSVGLGPQGAGRKHQQSQCKQTISHSCEHTLQPLKPTPSKRGYKLQIWNFSSVLQNNSRRLR